MQRVTGLLLCIVLALTTGCSILLGEKLQPSEKETLQALLYSIKQTEENIAALKQVEVERTNPEEFMNIQHDVNSIKPLVPAFLQTNTGYVESVPDRMRISDKDEEDMTKITQTILRSEATRKASERLFDQIALPKIKQAMDEGLGIIWSVKDKALYCSQTYAEAHNAFFRAYQRYADVVALPATVKYQDTLITLHPERGELEPLGETIPPEIKTVEAAEHILRSEKIFTRIVQLYLAAPDIFSSACGFPLQPPVLTPVPLVTVKSPPTPTPSIKEEFDRILGAPKMVTSQVTHTVTFTRGGYRVKDLPARELEELETFFEYLVTMIRVYNLNYPIHITMTTVGYTDDVRFRQAWIPHFLRSVETELGVRDDSLPRTGVQLRKALNVYLAEMRALSMEAYLKQRLTETLQYVQLGISGERVGKGEELPEDVDSTYPHQEDVRRRICNIRVHIEGLEK